MTFEELKALLISKYRSANYIFVIEYCVIVIRCVHHLTCVKDGVLIDTWNCGYKIINNYYILKA